MNAYINAHCHIVTCRDFTPGDAGVFCAVCNATRMDDWNDVLNLAKNTPAIWPCVGIHPWYAETARNDDWESEMHRILTANPRVMVGEIGLDRDRANSNPQVEIFVRQLKIAHEYNRVAHVHCVGAWGHLMRIFDELAPNIPRVVLHAFSGATEVADALAQKYDVYFSFSPAIMDARHLRVRRALSAVPMSRILCETDDAPMDILPAVAACIAKIRNIPDDEMVGILYKNTVTMLNG